MYKICSHTFVRMQNSTFLLLAFCYTCEILPLKPRIFQTWKYRNLRTIFLDSQAFYVLQLIENVINEDPASIAKRIEIT